MTSSTRRDTVRQIKILIIIMCTGKIMGATLMTRSPRNSLGHNRLNVTEATLIAESPVEYVWLKS